MNAPSLRIMAELANAHEGSFDRAQQLIDAAANAKADAVKFQRFTADELVAPAHPKYAHFQRLAFAPQQWRDLVAHARAAGLQVWSDVFGSASAAAMQEVGVDGFKIHASDIANYRLLEQVGTFHRPVLLGCGGSTWLEIRDAIEVLQRAGAPEIILMHGFQGFPTPAEETDVARLRALREFGLPVGLSDHVDGTSPWAMLVPLIAAAGGLACVEKHLTLDRAAKGIDHHSALEPREFAELVTRLRELPRWIGQGRILHGPAEHQYRQQMKKHAVAARALSAGQVITPNDIAYLRTGESVAPLMFRVLEGRTLAKPVPAFAPITLAHLSLRVVVLVIARLHSTRLPRKALLPIAGKPALAHLIERATLARSADEVIVCTSVSPEDDPLAALAGELGVRCVRGSPDDVLGRMLHAAAETSADLVVRATGDDVLLDPVHLDRAVAWHRRHNAEYTRINGLPSGAECEVFSVWALQRAHDLAEDASQTEYLTWYMNRPDVFEIATLDADPSVRRAYRLTLDTEDDLAVIAPALEAVYRPGQPYRFVDLLQWLDAHPEVASRNARVRQKLNPESVNTRLRVGASR